MSGVAGLILGDLLSPPESSACLVSAVSQQTVCDSANVQFFKLQLCLSVACTSSVSPVSQRPLVNTTLIYRMEVTFRSSGGGDRAEGTCKCTLNFFPSRPSLPPLTTPNPHLSASHGVRFGA